MFFKRIISITVKWKHPDRIFQQANFLNHVFVFVCLFACFCLLESFFRWKWWAAGNKILTLMVPPSLPLEPFTTHLQHHLVVPFTSAFVWFLKSSGSQQNNVQVSENQKGLKDKFSFMPSKNYNIDRSGCRGTSYPTVILRKHPQETGF